MNHRVLIRETLHRELADHLLSGFQSGESQEEACLALWYRGDGANRYTGILGEVVLPEDGERDLHGTVTVRESYLNRVLDRAIAAKAGVAILHSHPSRGWQDLSPIDDNSERNIIVPFIRETQLPLLGLTLAEDEHWSARFWQESRLGCIELAHCTDVRRVGTRHSQADSPPFAYLPYARRPNLRRTLDSWGIEAQSRLARTHVCVVGAGSVGSMVLEALARTGFEQITIIDPDIVEEHNLDRLVYADRHCLGLRKVDVAAAHVRRVTTARKPVVRVVPLSIRTERAYRLAADADVVICCVDNAEGREVLNYLAYSNCLPLMDGGVLVETRDRLLSAKWDVHLVGPDMRCLRCRGRYTSNEASDERQGLRRNGRYINDPLPAGPEPGQNTFAFCNVVAAEEMRLLVRYLVGEDWWHDNSPTSGRWSFEHRFVEAETEAFKHPDRCVATCEFTHTRLGLGELGRPPYPFLAESRESWGNRVVRGFRGLRRKAGRLVSVLLY